MRIPTVLLLSLLAALGAHADVVRCTDANGRIVYTDGACPSGSRSSRQVEIMESPPPDPTRQDFTPPPSAPAPAAPAPNVAQGPGLIVIPRNVNEPPPSDPLYVGGPDPYYDAGGRPIFRPRPQRPNPHDPPPGHRPCQNLAGIKRYTC